MCFDLKLHIIRRIFSHRQVAYGELIKTLVRVATTVRAGYFGVQVPEGAWDFLSSPKLPDRPWSPAVSCSVVTVDFGRDKVAGGCNWPLTSIQYCRGQERVEPYLCSSCMPYLHGQRQLLGCTKETSQQYVKRDPIRKRGAPIMERLTLIINK